MAPFVPLVSHGVQPCRLLLGFKLVRDGPAGAFAVMQFGLLAVCIDLDDDSVNGKKCATGGIPAGGPDAIIRGFRGLALVSMASETPLALSGWTCGP